MPLPILGLWRRLGFWAYLARAHVPVGVPSPAGERDTHERLPQPGGTWDVWDVPRASTPGAYSVLSAVGAAVGRVVFSEVVARQRPDVGAN